MLTERQRAIGSSDHQRTSMMLKSRPDSVSFAYPWHDTLGRQVEALVEAYPNKVRYLIISMLWPNPDKRGIGAEEAFFAEVVQPEQEGLRTGSI